MRSINKQPNKRVILQCADIIRWFEDEMKECAFVKEDIKELFTQLFDCYLGQEWLNETPCHVVFELLRNEQVNDKSNGQLRDFVQRRFIDLFLRMRKRIIELNFILTNEEKIICFNYAF